MFRQGRLAEAADLFKQLLSQQPANVDALQMLGLVEQQAGRPQAALSLFEKAVRIAPRHAMLNFNRGLVLSELGRFSQALDAYETALKGEPRYFKAHLMRATTLRKLERDLDALAAYDEAIAALPAEAEFHQARGSLLYEMKRYAQALESFERALLLRPGYVDALANLGCTLIKLSRPDEALKALDQSLALDASFADAHFNRGVVLASLSRQQEALGSYDRALTIAPALVDAIRSRGVALSHLNRLDEAVGEFDRALKLKPSDTGTLLDLANMLTDSGRLEDAVSVYEQALAINPQLDFAFDALLQARMKMCDWRNFDANLARLEASIGGKPLSSPAPLLALSNSAALQKASAEFFAAQKYPASTPIGGQHAGGAKIRIGYFSSDFFAHATAFLMAGMLERHDRSRFHVVAFSYGTPVADAMHRRLRAAFDEFIDVSEMSDAKVAALARKMEIDIAVDLKGLTQHGRPRIFALRAAPAQVSYLGYPCTMGSPAFDYLIADATLVREQDRPHYSEKIIYLPDSYQVNDSTREISSKLFTRSDAGLPESGFVFCSFNNPYKITPDVFEVWMHLLHRVDGSLLWLMEGTSAAVANLRSQAQSKGVDAERIVFARHMEPPEHLARHRVADLFLDTTPCNAHTTASDSLWAGLPLVTCSGETFASRVAASLLNAVGLPQLVTHSLAAYEECAFALAADAAKLAKLRETLATNRLRHPLFDTERFTRHLEAGYELIHARARAGLPPDHLVVPVIPAGPLRELRP